ncbi:MAG: M20/M25/M40 family metallo-hydrolase [Chitinophagaceae bacterium]|nr:M20/M25/M40 family metallo-hydrolase [Chitinophagaceae bacterium]
MASPNVMKGIFILWVILIASCTTGRKAVSKPEVQKPVLRENLKNHVAFLADDKLEGRRTGTRGEQLAMEYISRQFESIGLAPLGRQGFIQPFEINEGQAVDGNSRLLINGETLTLFKDYFPFPFSAEGIMEAQPLVAVRENDMPWFIDLHEILDENKNNPHFDLTASLRTLSQKMASRGASALFFYNTSKTDDKLFFDPKDKTEKASIPVFYLKKHVADKFFKNPSAMLNIKFQVKFYDKKRTGHNVIGFINNNAEHTVVIGAHYDHLGYGEDGNSRYLASDSSIHNGADDNASGTAALIELARILKSSKAKHNNYLFLAFSGEELGLFGSKYFTENPTIDLSKINYMINLDMVGRLNDSSRMLTVAGIGTSPAWGLFYNQELMKQYGQSLQFRFDSSGTGASDHTSFYRKNIPVLFYFTGLHSDYHKPSDDTEKINFEGMEAIVNHIVRLIEFMDSKSKLTFLKTRETSTGTSARFSVSLGIMPDYTYSGHGVKVDGVTEGRAAEKAGIKAGDIILQIGEFPVYSMETYMQTLSKFKKGDTTKVKYRRANKEFETTVVF